MVYCLFGWRLMTRGIRKSKMDQTSNDMKWFIFSVFLILPHSLFSQTLLNRSKGNIIVMASKKGGVLQKDKYSERDKKEVLFFNFPKATDLKTGVLFMMFTLTNDKCISYTILYVDNKSLQNEMDLLKKADAKLKEKTPDVWLNLEKGYRVSSSNVIANGMLIGQHTLTIESLRN